MVQDKILKFHSLTSSSFLGSTNSDIIPYEDDEQVEEVKSFDDLDFGDPENYSSMVLESRIKDVFLMVLKQCLDEFNILTNVFKPHVGEMESRKLTYRTLHHRLESNIQEHYEDYRIDTTFTNFHKLQKDIKTIIEVLKKTISEMDEKGTFVNIITSIQSLFKMRKDETKLFERIVEQKSFLDDLRTSSRKGRKEGEDFIERLKNGILEVKAKYENEMEYCRGEIRFSETWQRGREEQNRLRLEGKSKKFTSTTEQMGRNMETENRCHDEIQKILDEIREDEQNEIQFWMDHYEEEVERRDNEIYNIKVKTENLIEKKIELQEEYERRTQAIKDWLEYKIEKAEREKQLALEIWAATRIQSWWRGNMYRKQLGPYKKQKGKGKGKGKKKK